LGTRAGFGSGVAKGEKVAFGLEKKNRTVIKRKRKRENLSGAREGKGLGQLKSVGI